MRAARRIVEGCHRAGVAHLTLFAFSQENWQRPAQEVGLLMQLFVRTLSREVAALHRNRVRLGFIGDASDFPPSLRQQMREAEWLTRDNGGLHLIVAAGYGGCWDIVQAARSLCAESQAITAAAVESRLSTAGVPHPDLLIRTGGERRLSNFMLWQLAYTELYFTDVLWPDFDDAELQRALHWYAARERRFGRVPEAD